MGRELQKKKNRSSLHKIKHKPKSKKLNIRGNPIVARNWFVPFLSPFPSLLPSKLPKPLNPDLPYPRKLIPSTTNRNKHETLTQNYRRLGLVSKLNPRAGGVEPSLSAIPSSGTGAQGKAKAKDSLAIREHDADVLVPGTARIVRDEKGEVVRVLYHDREDEGKGKKEREREVEWRGRRLVDEMGDDDDEEEGTQHEIFTGGKDDDEDGDGVVRQLAIAARRGEKKKGGRKQSQREEEWVERLVGRYGDDVGKMARDRKLNPMQQSPSDIARRVRIWREGRRRRDNVEDDGDGGLEME